MVLPFICICAGFCPWKYNVIGSHEVDKNKAHHNRYFFKKRIAYSFFERINCILIKRVGNALATGN